MLISPPSTVAKQLISTTPSVSPFFIDQIVDVIDNLYFKNNVVSAYVLFVINAAPLVYRHSLAINDANFTLVKEKQPFCFKF